MFSLIILRKALPSRCVCDGRFLYNSVSELLSNQLSYWLSQVDQNRRSTSTSAPDQEAFNTFQLRLSYSFPQWPVAGDPRWQLCNQANRSEVSTIAGDWTVIISSPRWQVQSEDVLAFECQSITKLPNTQTAVVTGVKFAVHTANSKTSLRSARDRRRRIGKQPATNRRNG